MSIFEEYSEERKTLQEDGKLPSYFTTLGWKMFKEKYLYDCDTFEEQIDRITTAVAKHCHTKQDYMRSRWKQLIMDGHAYLATPPLANGGTDRGMDVSCSGGYVGDSIYDFGAARLEATVLTQEGFGTSAYLGGIRERGAVISRGGTANGVVPVFDDMVIASQKVSQGGTRRGAWAGYLPIDHGDFWELADFVKQNPDGANVGWVISNEVIQKLNEGDEDLTKRFQRALLIKCITGRGYFYFVDKVNANQPECYKTHGLSSKASNLCTEITLHSDADHSYTCVLSGMICSTYDEWKDTDAVYCMTVFLDCLVSEFLDSAKGVRGMENVIRGTEKGRAIGLGLSGFHSYLQQNMTPFGSFDAHMKNHEIFSHLQDESSRASKWMAKEWGEPLWCKGTGYRNTHRTALAPNVSSSLIFGSESQGVTPWYGNVYSEGTAAGGMYRVNPVFIEVLKKHGKYSEDILLDVLGKGGSVQHLEFLTQLEKSVLLTAFEINQEDILRLAAARQPYICQSQSLNLFFNADEDESYIAYIHQLAFENPWIFSLYYLRSKAGVQASKGACSTCES